ncbi:hypothetical protein HY639_02840 [Candidatus Woesearchaeota archaeon]|nr:hypothetical protein [Candidatus Woesearchaeota archaeon]
MKKLEELVGDDFCYLAIGEPAFGTAIYDPAMMDGLAAFLHANPSTAKKIKYLIINGGLIPEIPEFYSKYNAQKMRFLGSDPTKPPIGWVNDLLQQGGIDEKTKEYLEKFALHVIENRKEAVDYTKQELQKLLVALPSLKEIHYIHGEEDKKNLVGLEELKIVDYQQKERKEADLEQKLQLLQDQITRTEGDVKTVAKQREFLTKARNYLRNRDPAEFKKYVQTLIKQHDTELAKLSVKEGLVLKEFLLAATSRDQLQKKIGELNGEITQYAQEQEDKTKAMRELELNLNALQKEKQLGPRIIKRREIQPAEASIIFRLTKEEYNHLLYSVVDVKDRKKLHIHSDAETTLTLDGIVLTMSHTTNYLSDNPTKTSLKTMKAENTYAARMRHVVPDIRLCAHGLDGFRFQPQPKYTENTVEGEERKTPECVVNLQLPTFQSYAQLEYYKDKNIKNWHIVRYRAHNFASGIVIHTVKKNGVHSLEYVDGRDFAEAGRQLHALQEEAAHASAKKKKVEAAVAAVHQRLIVQNPARIEHNGDVHIGVGNDFGRPSNYEFVDAVQKYQQEHGLPHAVVTSELVHGVWKRPFDSTKQYFSMLPTKVEEAIKAIKTGKLSDEKKIEQLEKLLLKNIYAYGLNTEDDQKKEIRYRLVPYFEKILSRGGHLVIVSGNHYNTTFTGDEAPEIAMLVDRRYEDRVTEIHGKGQPGGGRNQFRLFGHLMYAMHKPRSGKDELNGAMPQIRGSNQDADVVFLFHLHQPGGAFADGTAYSMNPGMQPWDQYVDEIGKQGSLRGIMNLEVLPMLNPAQPPIKYFKWTPVLDPTLEKYMKR